jgi:hypothetical protein
MAEMLPAEIESRIENLLPATIKELAKKLDIREELVIAALGRLMKAAVVRSEGEKWYLIAAPDEP